MFCLWQYLIFIISLAMVTGHDYHEQLKLHRDIFTDYNRSIRPLLNQSEQINVGFTFELLNIESMDITTQTLTVTVWSILSWVDELLVWNKTHYGGAQELFVQSQDSSNLWTPTIIVMNTIGDFKQLSKLELPVKVESSGLVTLESGLSLSTHCDADITYYPFDTQSCEIVIAAVTYSINQLNLTLEGVLTNNYRKNGEWEILHLNGTRQLITLDKDPESQIKITFTLKRLRPFFVMNLVIPLMLLSSMNVAVFALPVKSGERMGLAITSLLSFAVFLSVISDSLPNTSQNSPIVGIYVLMTFILSTLSVCLSVFILNLHDRQGEPVPTWLTNFVIQCSGACPGKRVFTAVGPRPAEVPNHVRQIDAKAVDVNRLPVRLGSAQKICPDSLEKGDVTEAHLVRSINPPHDQSKYPVDYHQNNIDWNTVVNFLDHILFWIFFVVCFTVSVTVIILWVSN